MAKIVKKVSVRRDRAKSVAVQGTAKEFDVTPVYVYAVLRGDRTDGLADEITRAYNNRYKEVKKVLGL